jgi:hypothetical protein
MRSMNHVIYIQEENIPKCQTHDKYGGASPHENDVGNGGYGWGASKNECNITIYYWTFIL